MSEIEAELASPATVDGRPADLTIADDGATLRWRFRGGGERCLTLESEVLGVSRGEEGPIIKVRAFVKKEGGGWCDGGAGGVRRVRRDFVFELPSEEVKRVWSERLRASIDQLGELLRFRVFFFRQSNVRAN